MQIPEREDSCFGTLVFTAAGNLLCLTFDLLPGPLTYEDQRLVLNIDQKHRIHSPVPLAKD